MVQVAAVSGLDGEAGEGAHPGAGQSVMDGSGGHSHGDGNRSAPGWAIAVGEQQYRSAAAHQVDGVRA